MFVWTGNRRYSKKLGFVAEFCPFCRTITPVRISEQRVVRHLYGIPIWFPKSEGHRGQCHCCKLHVYIDIEKYERFSTFSKSIDELAQETYPTINSYYKERFKLEQDVKRNQLSDRARQVLLEEPFDLLSVELRDRYASTIIDWKTGLFLLLLIISPLTIAWIGEMVLGFSGDEFDHIILPIMGGVITFFGVVTAWLFFTRNSRFLQSRVYPVLARSIQPLNPTAQEIDSILLLHKANGYRTGKVLKSSHILNHFASSKDQFKLY